MSHSTALYIWPNVSQHGPAYMTQCSTAPPCMCGPMSHSTALHIWPNVSQYRPARVAQCPTAQPCMCGPMPHITALHVLPNAPQHRPACVAHCPTAPPCMCCPMPHNTALHMWHNQGLGVKHQYPANRPASQYRPPCVAQPGLLPEGSEPIPTLSTTLKTS